MPTRRLVSIETQINMTIPHIDMQYWLVSIETDINMTIPHIKMQYCKVLNMVSLYYYKHKHDYQDEGGD